MSVQQQVQVPGIIIDSRGSHQYRTMHLLGKGGFASVYEVQDTLQNLFFACKVTPKERLAKRKLLEKFEEEIKIHKMLKHPNICECLQVFKDTTNYYILLELCDEITLSHLFKKRSGLTEEEIERIAYETLSAVNYLQQNQIVHRDLKSSNIFLKKQNGYLVTKIGDFGLSAMIENNINRFTLCGTPNFLSPEIIASHVARRLSVNIACDPNIDDDCIATCQKLTQEFQGGHSYKTDVWSLGCVLYQLAFAKAPFESSTITQTYKKILKGDFAFPQRENRKFSQYFFKFVEKMLRMRPSERPTVEELLNDAWIKNGYAVKLKGLPEQVKQADFNAEYYSSEPMRKYLNYIESIEDKCLTFENLQVVQSDSEQLLTVRQFLHINYQQFKINGKYYQAPDTLRIPPLYYCQFYNRNIIPAADDPLDDYEKAGHLAAHLGLHFTRYHTIQYIYSWCDYEDKYGFAYELSNGAIGAYFNDNSVLIISPNKIFADYQEHEEIPRRAVFEQLEALVGTKKTRLIKYFIEVLENRSIAPISDEHKENADFLFAKQNLQLFYKDSGPTHDLRTFDADYARNIARRLAESFVSDVRALGQSDKLRSLDSNNLELIIYNKLLRYGQDIQICLKKYRNEQSNISFMFSNGEFQNNNNETHCKIIIDQKYLLLLNENRHGIAYQSDIVVRGEFMECPLGNYITGLIQKVSPFYEEFSGTQ